MLGHRRCSSADCYANTHWSTEVETEKRKRTKKNVCSVHILHSKVIYIFYRYNAEKMIADSNRPEVKQTNAAAPDTAQSGPSRPDTTPFPKAKPIDPTRVQQHGRAKVWQFYNHHPVTNENASRIRRWLSSELWLLRIDRKLLRLIHHQLTASILTYSN